MPLINECTIQPSAFHEIDLSRTIIIMAFFLVCLRIMMWRPWVVHLWFYLFKNKFVLDICKYFVDKLRLVSHVRQMRCSRHLNRPTIGAYYRQSAPISLCKLRQSVSIFDDWCGIMRNSNKRNFFYRTGYWTVYTDQFKKKNGSVHSQRALRCMRSW